MAPALVYNPVDTNFSCDPIEATHNRKEQKNSQHEIEVVLPDLFVSFLSRKPQLNPYYENIREESEAWVSKNCQLSPKESRRISKANFSYFIAIMAREAGPDEYRTICDWGNWVFPFDDMFDEGSLKDDPERAGQEMQNLLAAMETTDSEKALPQSSPLVEAHNSIWFRIAKLPRVGIPAEKYLRHVARLPSPGARERFVRAMRDYSNAALDQVQNQAQRTVLDPKSLLETRRQSIGVTPLFAMIEYFYDLDLPDEVFEHPSMIEMEKVATDFVLIHNDMLSYSKEQREGFDHNLVALYRSAGMGPQEAFDQMEELLKARLRGWHLALADLPQWGEAIDMQVQKYIGAVQDVVLANLNWR
ncbi:hypothetical protein MMC22_009036 [Lobaria immixta]|nr:hypothetical protein [Lobaria immixta]